MAKAKVKPTVLSPAKVTLNSEKRRMISFAFAKEVNNEEQNEMLNREFAKIGEDIYAGILKELPPAARAEAKRLRAMTTKQYNNATTWLRTGIQLAARVRVAKPKAGKRKAEDFTFHDSDQHRYPGIPAMPGYNRWTFQEVDEKSAIGKRLLASAKAFDKCRGDYSTIRVQFEELLVSCRNVKQLLDHWPTAQKYIPEEWFEIPKANLAPINIRSFEANIAEMIATNAVVKASKKKVAA